MVVVGAGVPPTAGDIFTRPGCGQGFSDGRSSVAAAQHRDSGQFDAFQELK
jgi:hypothetical protein